MKKNIALAVIILLLVGIIIFRRRDVTDEVVRLKEVPEIDASAISEYMEYTGAEIGLDKLAVVILGKAVKDLGGQVPVSVDRFQDGRKVDTVPAYIILNAEPKLPEGYVINPDPGAGGPPPFDFNIYAGDPVAVGADATMLGGRFTKLVLRPDTSRPVVYDTFYDPERDPPYLSDLRSGHQTKSEAIAALAAQFGESVTWVEANMGSSNGLEEIHISLGRAKSGNANIVP